MKLPPTTIWYHGTRTAEEAAAIATGGFHPGTYFGRHLEDALGYGGPYIFEVAFPSSWTSEDGWQMVVPTSVPPDQIVAHYTLTQEGHFENEPLRKAIFESNTQLVAHVRRPPRHWAGPPPEHGHGR